MKNPQGQVDRLYGMIVVCYIVAALIVRVVVGACGRRRHDARPLRSVAQWSGDARSAQKGHNCSLFSYGSRPYPPRACCPLGLPALNATATALAAVIALRWRVHYRPIQAARAAWQGFALMRKRSSSFSARR